MFVEESPRVLPQHGGPTRTRPRDLLELQEDSGAREESSSEEFDFALVGNCGSLFQRSLTLPWWAIVVIFVRGV